MSYSTTMLIRSTLCLLLTTYFSFQIATASINCYVCMDCGEEGKYNSSHLVECKKNQDKCVKMDLVGGQTDRACGDSKKCMGREPPRRKRAVESDFPFLSHLDVEPELYWTHKSNLPARKRIARGLLPTKPNKGKNNGKKYEAAELSVLYCCSEDGCNAGTTFWNKRSSDVFEHPLLTCVLSVYFVFSWLVTNVRY